jgi:hypothetical protein
MTIPPSKLPLNRQIASAREAVVEAERQIARQMLMINEAKRDGLDGAALNGQDRLPLLKDAAEKSRQNLQKLLDRAADT